MYEYTEKNLTKHKKSSNKSKMYNKMIFVLVFKTFLVKFMKSMNENVPQKHL